MKKVLLGTTALLGAGLVASPAFAADGIKLGVGGFFKTAYMVNFDDDGEGELGNERNTDGVFSDAEIHFDGSTVLDNGLEVGGHVELEGETATDQIDEAYVFFSGGFGEFRMGSQDDALAVGSPVIATAVGGVPEVVRHGENGLLVPPGDPEALAAAIRRFFEEDGLRGRLAEAAARSVAGFTEEAVFARIEEELERAERV